MPHTSFAQIQAARLKHAQTNQPTAPNQDPINDQGATLVNYGTDTTVIRDITYQRCGGGRRVLRKNIGGN